MQPGAETRLAGGLTVAPPPGVRDRVAARLRARRLDRALARGVHPEATAALALRARRLTGSCRRRVMADGYRRVPVKARGRLDGVGADFAGIAERLAGPGPVTARGAARAWLLLTDGTGPLYNSPNAIALQACASRTLHSLGLEPVDTKVEPD
jgi:hypothetical protein